MNGGREQLTPLHPAAPAKRRYTEFRAIVQPPSIAAVVATGSHHGELLGELMNYTPPAEGGSLRPLANNPPDGTHVSVPHPPPLASATICPHCTGIVDAILATPFQLEPCQHIVCPLGHPVVVFPCHQRRADYTARFGSTLAPAMIELAELTERARESRLPVRSSEARPDAHGTFFHPSQE
jgi:hypothetical protein